MSFSELTDPDVGEKVVVTGDMNVGKTSIMTRLVKDVFNPDVKSTVGCEHFEKEFNMDGQRIKLSIWDTAGQERYRGLASCYYRKAKCVIVVYDITKRSSFDKIDFWKNEIVNYTDQNVPVILVGNKSDEAPKRTVKREEAEAVVRKYKFVAYFETSAKVNDGNRVEEVFKLAAKMILDNRNFVDSVTQQAPGRKGPKPSATEIKPKDDSGCKC